MRHGRRPHLLTALEIAAETGYDARKEDSRREHHQGRIDASIPYDACVYQKACQLVEAQGGNETEPRHEGHGHPKDAVSAGVILPGHLFRHQDGNGHGHPGRADGQHQQIDRVGHLIEPDALTAQHAGKEDAVDGPQDLDEKPSSRQNQGTL